MPKLQLPIHVGDSFVSSVVLCHLILLCIVSIFSSVLSNTPYVNWWCKVVIFGVIPDRCLLKCSAAPLSNHSIPRIQILSWISPVNHRVHSIQSSLHIFNLQIFNQSSLNLLNRQIHSTVKSSIPSLKSSFLPPLCRGHVNLLRIAPLLLLLLPPPHSFSSQSKSLL